MLHSEHLDSLFTCSVFHVTPGLGMFLPPTINTCDCFFHRLSFKLVELALQSWKCLRIYIHLPSHSLLPMTNRCRSMKAQAPLVRANSEA